MGIDAVLGLVPVVGDAISAAIGSYIIWEARRLGAPRWLVARMAMNTTLDTLVGSIPVVGDVFDVALQIEFQERRATKAARRETRRAATAAAPSTRRNVDRLSAELVR